MTRHAKALLVRLITTVLAVAGLALVTTTTTPAAQAAPGDIGYADYLYGPPTSTTNPDLSPTASKPQSKLWFAQGKWWGVLQQPNTTTTTIHLYDENSHIWSDTGVVVDNRTDPTQADVLWDSANAKLYIASAGRPGTASGIRVMRFRYDPATAKWVTDLPTKAINAGGVEAAVIARDTTNRLWVAYTAEQAAVPPTSTPPGTPAGRNVRVVVSDAAQTTWSTPAAPPVDGTFVSTDDIATIIAHDSMVSVVWSSQNADAAGNTAIYAAQHPDSAAPTAGWSTSAKIFSGPKAADDHLALTSAEGSGSGTVYAVVKTGQDDSVPVDNAAGLIRLLVLRPGASTWQSYIHSTVGDGLTRPIVLLEPAKKLIHVFATAPVVGGVIYEKTSSMDTISFSTGKGTPFIQLAAHGFVNNPTSTKQNITAASGTMVLASDQTTGWYVHNYVPGTAVAKPVASFTTNPTPATGFAPLDVTFTDTSTGATSWRWDFGDGTTFTGQNPPKHTYTTVGTYTVTLTASNPSGRSTATGTVTVKSTVPAPVASFTWSPTTGTAPLAVRFTDTSTGAPTSWAWTFGDGGTSTQKSPTYTFAKAGTYTVTLKATNQGGTSTRTNTVTVSAAPAPAPTVVLDKPAAAVTLTKYVDVAWHATTAPTAVKGYDVEVRSIGYGKGSQWATTVLTNQTGVAAQLPGQAGYTYCMRVRGTNTAGVVGAWSAPRCTSLPLDDRAMSRKGKWRKAGGTAYYMGTASITRQRGASLTKTVTGKQVFLLIAKRSGGGKVKVYEGSKLVKKVSLSTKRAETGLLIPIASHTEDTTSRYRVVVKTSGKPVIIDGLAATR
jgi:PKD repeat protein